MAHFDDIYLSNNMLVSSTNSGIVEDGHDLRTNANIRQFVVVSNQKRRSFTIGKIRESLAFYEEMTELFNVVGRGSSFLGRDAADWNSTAGNMVFGTALWTASDQPLLNPNTGGTQGDGSTTLFHLIKRYSKGSGSVDRRIYKPDSSNLLVAEDGTPTVLYTPDTANGYVTFDTAPSAAVNVTWGGDFWVPMHFAADLQTILSLPNLRSATPAFEETNLAIV